MKVIKDPKRLNEILRVLDKKGSRIGFVPTMGFLHEGHLSLVRRARRENDVVVVSIFVNPLQFGPREDFKQYPRDLNRDRRLLKRERIDFLFTPSRRAMFPKHFGAFVSPGPLARHLCGRKRPGHFRGVVTVVCRLFEMIRPHTAYFGEKDYQQAKIIQDMVRRLHLKVKVRTCPIVREPDGVAMSSRNSYLSRAERICARALYQSLLWAQSLIRSGERNSQKVKRAVTALLASYAGKIDYVEIIDPLRLRPMKTIKLPALVALACYMGSTRLIDNILIKR